MYNSCLNFLSNKWDGFCATNKCVRVKQGMECVEQIKELVLGQCEKACSAAVQEQFHQAMQDTSQSVGLLLSERFINVPPQIALPLYTQLL